MNRASWTLMALVGALLLGLWAVLNRPDQAPDWPDTIQGVSFSPFRAGQSPHDKTFPTDVQIQSDLRLLRGKVNTVRTYTVEDNLGHVPHLAAPLGINVYVGIWLIGDAALDRIEIDRFKALFPTYGDNVTGIVVGNESLLRGDLTVSELTAYLDEIRQFVGGVPVTTAETWDVWLKSPKLALHVDFLSVHVLPYWEGVKAENTPDYIFQRFGEVQRKYRWKPVMLGEVGWPSEGRQRGGSVPSLQNQAKVLRGFLYEAERRNVNYFIIEAFDQVWKTDEGAVGRYWGIFNSEREPKFAFSTPISPLPDWPAIAGFSLAFTILIVAFLLRDSQGLVHRGRGFLVLVSYLISFAVVWLVFDYSSKYLTWEQVVVGVGLLIAAVCISLVLLAEAHEWAEAIWTRRQSDDPAAADHATRTHWPKVSLHIPTYNEPPDMVLRTLRALEQLDYPDLEVVLVDNNTDDEAVWKPVERWCAERPERFRFFHVNPLAGFKAGALNFALEQTAPDAEIVAVIDSDYEVTPQWLRECIPLFDDRQVAIVQAPQDYRDSRENAFKAMLYDEYAGFFGIGMLTRNARNAIIQHGTMTLVRRDTLETVGRWSEWCITEDAELGLRVLAAGYKAQYVPRSYGRGLIPDNFLDFKKQRFRWAYGSMLILRHHLRYFLKLEPSKLTAGQRYHFVAGWLPWMADGLSLAFNSVALGYAVMMVVMPNNYTPPEVALSLLPIAFFGFKLTKMLMLYRRRMLASWRQAIAAGMAGLAVSHTIARAMLAGLTTRHIGFFRTPKMAEGHSLLQALADAREELLFGIALVLAAGAIGLRDDAYLLDTRLWMTLLLVQSLPYWSAVALSIISTRTDLPASLIDGEQDDTLLERLPDSLSNNAPSAGNKPASVGSGGTTMPVEIDANTHSSSWRG